jgi:hypothetical protein
LLLEYHQGSTRTGAGLTSRVVQEHQGKEAQHLGFVRHELAQDPRKANGFGGQLTTHS